jgi:hypothetical protein
MQEASEKYTITMSTSIMLVKVEDGYVWYAVSPRHSKPPSSWDDVTWTRLAPTVEIKAV